MRGLLHHSGRATFPTLGNDTLRRRHPRGHQCNGNNRTETFNLARFLIVLGVWTAGAVNAAW
jgi:hypothetical protein